MVILINGAVQQVLWVITHELSDPGRAKKKSHKGSVVLSMSPVVSPVNTRWLWVAMPKPTMQQGQQRESQLA